MSDWRDYQEEVAGFFRSLGLPAETNVRITGARTTHDVDVVVRPRVAGFELTWLVECKLWQDRVPKEKILALRAIVDDSGADRGVVMAEGGYQSGALEASRYANVLLTSLADLRETLAYELGEVELRTLPARLEACRERYWDIDKNDRIATGLRAEVGAPGFSGAEVIKAVAYVLDQATFYGFPMKYDRTIAALLSAGGRRGRPVAVDDPEAISSPTQLYRILDSELRELEERLERAQRTLGIAPP